MPGNDEGRPPPGDEPAHIEALLPTEPPTSSDSTTDSPQNINYDWEAAWNKPAPPTITDDMSQLDVALALASARMYVFPVDHPELSQCAGIGKNHNPATCDQRGKHPVVAFSVAADINPKMITMWWAGPPRNIGINCGKSNLVVVDEDRLGEFKRYADEHHVIIPPTMVVATAKGRHYYFSAREDHPLGNKEGAFQDYSINIRAGNGYVVAPGSIHATGVVYRIEVDLPPAPIPDWVIAGINEKATSPNGKVEPRDPFAPRGLDAVPHRIRGPRADSGGERHSVLVSYASRLRALSLTRTEAEPLFRRVWERCEQPPDCTAPLPWDDALTKLDDVYSRYPEGKSANYRKVSAEEIHALAGNPVPNGSELESSAARQARITWADKIEPEPVTWAWKTGDDGRIPTASLSIAAGREGTGKSSFGILTSALITNGTLPGCFHGAPRRVLYVAIEDSWKFTLVPRLIAAGADRSKVGRFEVVTVEGDEVTLSLPLDNTLLERTIVENEIAMVVIDPIMSVISDRIDTHVSRDVRRALDPLAKIAERTGCVILGVAHFNKASGTDAASLLSGSHAFRDVPRSLFGFARDDSDGSRVMTQVKNSLGRDDLPSLSYKMESAFVDTKWGLAETARFVFGGESERSVADFLRDSRRDSDDPEERRSAASWIKDYLNQVGGKALVKDVLAAGKAVGYAEQTLKNVRRKVADTDQSGFGKDQVHKWILRTDTSRDTRDTGNEKPVPQVSQSVSLLPSGPAASGWRSCDVCGHRFLSEGETTCLHCEATS
jgi:hypothetical protein